MTWKYLRLPLVILIIAGISLLYYYYKIKKDASDYFDFATNLRYAAVETSDIKNVNLTDFSIRGDVRKVIYAHPRTVIKYKVYLEGEMELETSIMIDEKAWSQDKGDGVLFEIFVYGKEEGKNVFHQHINPIHVKDDREWNEVIVDLSEFAGEEVEIAFVTTAGNSDDYQFDWAAWEVPLLVAK